MDEPKKQVNWYVRILIIVIAILIASMIVYRYFTIDPRAEISAGIIILLAFLIVLSLSEAFDSFSVGEILKLSKTVKQKEKEINKKESELAKVEIEKRELFSQFVSLSNSINLRQSNTNIYGLSADGLKQISIQKADATELEEQKKNEELATEVEQLNKAEALKGQETTVRANEEKRIDNEKLQELALRKYLTTNNIDISKIFREVKLQALQGIDPISERSPIFDAYLNDFDKEVFFHITRTRFFPSTLFLDRLYLMLSKLFHYKTVKKTNIYLVVIMVELPGEENRSKSLLYRINDLFQPSLNNNLLRLNTIQIDTTEIEDLYQ